MSDPTQFRRFRVDLCATLVAFAAMISIAGGSRAATSLEPVFQTRGPERARGVVVYSHGRSLVGEDSESPAPAYLKDMAKAGWDVLRFNRPSSEDTLSASALDLTRRADTLKAQGYRRVILTGQSFGAFLSIMAAERTEAVDGVIATAPAAYGNYADSYDTWRMNATALYKELANLHHARILLAFFHGDEYDPGGRGEQSVNLLTRAGNFGVVIDQPQGLVGHLAAATPQFAKRYASCLARFAEATLDDDHTCQDSLVIRPSKKDLPRTAGLAPSHLGQARLERSN